MTYKSELVSKPRRSTPCVPSDQSDSSRRRSHCFSLEAWLSDACQEFWESVTKGAIISIKVTKDLLVHQHRQLMFLWTNGEHVQTASFRNKVEHKNNTEKKWRRLLWYVNRHITTTALYFWVCFQGRLRNFSRGYVLILLYFTAIYWIVRCMALLSAGFKTKSIHLINYQTNLFCSPWVQSLNGRHPFLTRCLSQWLNA